MKDHLSGRKQLLAFALAAAFALCTAVPVLAGSGYLESNGLPYQTIDVYATHNSVVYNVSLEWGTMDFHYNYGTGWDYSNQVNGIQFNEIKVGNSCNAPVAVEFKFEPSIGNFTGTFNTEYKNTGTNYKALYLSEYTDDNLDAEISSSLYLHLNGKPSIGTDKQLIGNVVVTLVDVLSDDAQLISDCDGADNIGYVTSASQLVPFTQKDQY